MLDSRVVDALHDAREGCVEYVRGIWDMDQADVEILLKNIKMVLDICNEIELLYNDGKLKTPIQ